MSTAARRRVGVVVAEAALSSAVGPSQSASAVVVDTPLAPVMLGPSAGVSSDPAAVDLIAPDGTMLGTARVSADDLSAARARWWGRVAALMWALAAVGLVLMTGPLTDWRATARTRGPYLGVSALAAGALSGAWWSAHRALRAGAGDGAAAVGFLITALFVAALVWLAWTTTGRWRIARRHQHGAVRGSPWAHLVHAVLGAGIGVAVAHYDVLVTRVLPLPASEAIRFALSPWTPRSAGGRRRRGRAARGGRWCRCW